MRLARRCCRQRRTFFLVAIHNPIWSPRLSLNFAELRLYFDADFHSHEPPSRRLVHFNYLVLLVVGSGVGGRARGGGARRGGGRGGRRGAGGGGGGGRRAGRAGPPGGGD